MIVKKMDGIYKYSYNNNCYEHCPEGTTETGDFICKANGSGKKLLYNCSDYDPLIALCNIIGVNNSTEIYNILTGQILSEYMNEKIQIFGGGNNVKYHITTGKNELELLKSEEIPENYTLSIVDLGECENKLKQEYNLKEDDTLIILKQETSSDNSSDKDVQFEVFEPNNKTRLNKSICSSDIINIYVKLKLSPELEALNEELQKLGYNMFDINDRFYTDICTPFKSSHKTDIILSDKIEDIYNNLYAQCQSNCEFSGYVLGSQYINCTCNITKTEEKEKVKVEKFKPKKLYESFIDVLKYSNYKILRCYKLIGSKRMITKNIGNLMLIILFIVYLYSLISYIIRGIIPLKERVKEEMKKEKEGGIKGLYLENMAKSQKDKEDKTKNKKKKDKKDGKTEKTEKNKKKDKKKDKKNNHFPPKKSKNKNLNKATTP